uniref:Uncharacterized protein n=1 Tax=Panagrolaimus sp. JU765 TaxID=591449 RepID=A0AC34Q4V8_9BILA
MSSYLLEVVHEFRKLAINLVIILNFFITETEKDLGSDLPSKNLSNEESAEVHRDSTKENEESNFWIQCSYLKLLSQNHMFYQEHLWPDEVEINNAEVDGDFLLRLQTLLDVYFVCNLDDNPDVLPFFELLKLMKNIKDRRSQGVINH